MFLSRVGLAVAVEALVVFVLAGQTEVDQEDVAAGGVEEDVGGYFRVVPPSVPASALPLSS